MLTSPQLPRFTEPPLRMEVQTSDRAQLWSMYTLHESSPPGFDSGWALLHGLSPQERQCLERLCVVDSERVFPAVVNNELSVVVEQEFQASDCGDAWQEDSADVIGRLRRSLLPRLQSSSVGQMVQFGVVADPRVTFCGRPTLMVAMPASTTTPDDVRGVLNLVLGFAYPGLH